MLSPCLYESEKVFDEEPGNSFFASMYGTDQVFDEKAGNSVFCRAVWIRLDFDGKPGHSVFSLSLYGTDQGFRRESRKFAFCHICMEQTRFSTRKQGNLVFFLPVCMEQIRFLTRKQVIRCFFSYNLYGIDWCFWDKEGNVVLLQMAWNVVLENWVRRNEIRLGAETRRAVDGQH